MTSTTIEDPDSREDINPHHVFDGQWGGWGRATWFSGVDFGWPRGDVLEQVAAGAGAYRWARVWENDKQCWRALTSDEIAALPEISQ